MRQFYLSTCFPFPDIKAKSQKDDLYHSPTMSFFPFISAGSGSICFVNYNSFNTDITQISSINRVESQLVAATSRSTTTPSIHPRRRLHPPIALNVYRAALGVVGINDFAACG